MISMGRCAAMKRASVYKKIFDELPAEMQMFLANPTNMSYMETAKTLSEMDVQRLRLVAESLLEITY
ncbi:MAG: hypothetical protein M5U34_31730 [Chloroflexi bacterium]|nr:hypothetical protein [Chloroflexota bacterium]